MCRKDELKSMMSWVGCLLKDTELFVLFAENNQILLKISVIPILLTFIHLVALNLLVNNQLNSSLRHIIVTIVFLNTRKNIHSIW
jgi:ABC-type Na+ efflux pump permease subunit